MSLNINDIVWMFRTYTVLVAGQISGKNIYLYISICDRAFIRSDNLIKLSSGV